MLKLLTSAQIREADNFTIENQPISSIDLMEAAADAFADIFIQEFPDYDKRISIYCGTGNNGGDGLAIARILYQKGYQDVSVKIARFSDKSSPDFELNRRRLEHTQIPVTDLTGTGFPAEDADIIIDAILGSGLNKPPAGSWKSLVKYINDLGRTVVAVDIPTGFPSEGIIKPGTAMINAELVITFQRPKINFLLPESESVFNRFEVADIGLDESFIQSQNSGWNLIEGRDIREIIRPRKQFSHKGTYGHALIVAGEEQTMGAALLCAGACLHTGAGLTTACIPAAGLVSLNTRYPEIMALIRHDESFDFPDLKRYNSIAAGPGMGVGQRAADLLKKITGQFSKPIVADADALNILAENPKLLRKLPKNSILTPHVKEFDRLFGQHAGWWQRLQTAKEQASALELFIVLKNRYTFIVSPDQEVFINPTGGPSMATGGMGDVLTGMIVSFLAQGYEPLHASMLGTYIHGLCGQLCGSYVCTASELIKIYCL